MFSEDRRRLSSQSKKKVLREDVVGGKLLKAYCKFKMHIMPKVTGPSRDGPNFA